MEKTTAEGATMAKDEQQEQEKALEYVVSKSNEMIQRSRYSLPLREQRALDYAISKIQKQDKPGKLYKVDPKEAYRIVTSADSDMGGKEYRQAYQIFRSLQYRPLEIYPRAGLRVSCSWFDHVTIDENTGELEFQFHNMLTPYLFQLSRNFTAYYLEHTAKMKSVYGPRLYQVLKSYAKGKNTDKTFTLDEFKEAVGASFEAVQNGRGVYEVRAIKSYQLYGKLKQAVIEPAVEDINRCSNVRVTYEEIKTGRKVTGIKFMVEDAPGDRAQRDWEMMMERR